MVTQRVLTKRDPERILYVVAYDIPCDKRRTAVHRILKGFGEWTEFSLFECFLSKKEFLQLQTKMYPHLDHRKARVRIYTICQICVAKVETIGLVPPKEQTSFLI